ncbi:MAG: serine/threonine-protein kinase [Terriglobales bacterium]
MNAKLVVDSGVSRANTVSDPAIGSNPLPPGVDSDPDATLDAGATAADALAPSSNSIGPYHLVRKLGEGGMGQVWLAEQSAPVKRQVALKIIKAGSYDGSAMRRFDQERQTLAIMDHPAIAKVFDAGSTAQGQPYFVMEYVQGIAITEYCDRRRLPTRDRLALFTKVCEGVQHAHQKAIIHRDLKPSNILVVEIDGKPMPRIIDFGIAKAIAQHSDDETMVTRIGGMVGTPGYMSPEQADPSVLDIDTRTDVYSLGVVLYELLTSAMPFDVKEWRSKPFHEVLRQLHEEDPASPSTRISVDPTSDDVAEKRSTDPRQLAGLLRGDLDWITLKALEKDRARRYGSPSELAADIDRYLRNEPVTARPASAAYRAGKYIQRHKFGVAAATAMLLLLVAFGVMQTIQLRRTTRERDRADRVTEFMSGMFKVSDPSEARGNTITAREILDKSSNAIETGLRNDPELQAKMMYTMGDTYWGLGLYSRAQALIERALEIQRRVLGPEHPDTLRSMRILASILEDENHHAESEKLKRQTLDLDRKVLGPENDETLRCESSLATSVRVEGRFAEAEKLDREVFEAQRRVLGPEARYTLLSMSNLASDITKQGRYSEAEKPERDALDMQRRVLGPEDPYTQATMIDLATVLVAEGRYPEADKFLREAIEIRRRVLGPHHPNTLFALQHLGSALLTEGHYDEAEKVEREVVDIDRRLPSAETYMPYDLTNEADALARMGRFAEAEKLYREAIHRLQSLDQPAILAVDWYNVACLAALAGRHNDAIDDLGQAVDHGYTDAAHFTADTDLTSLHGDPRFDALVEKAKEKTRQAAAAKPQ